MIRSLRSRWILALCLLIAAPAAGQEPASDPSAEDLARLLPLAQERDLNREVTVRNAEERLELWKMILLIDPNHLEARMGFDRARDDLTEARAQEAAARESEVSAEEAKAERLRLAETALYRADFGRADNLIEEVLEMDADDPRARSLQQAVRTSRAARSATRLWLVAGILLGVLGLVGGIWLLLRWRRRRQAEAEFGASAPPEGAFVQVVEGVGQGLLVPLQGDIFRIGAADSEQAERRNDLILSDAGALISRYHCEVLRRDRGFVLLDHSLNGTTLNGKPLARGGQQSLRDGDEVVLAGTSKLKFMLP